MMADCDTRRVQLQHLTVPYLKEILAVAGAPRSGRKADLVQRICALASDAHVVNSQRREMLQRMEAILGERFGPSSPLMKTTSYDGYGRPASAGATPADPRLRCPCNGAVAVLHSTGTVECGQCGALQHASCMRAVPIDRERHTCEVCRLADVDPTSRPLPDRPLSMLATFNPFMGATTKKLAGSLVLSEASLALVRADRRYQLRVCCLDISPRSASNKVGDFHRWPLNLELKINDVPVPLAIPPPSWDAHNAKYKVRPIDEIPTIADLSRYRLRASNTVSAWATVQHGLILTVRIARVEAPRELAQEVKVRQALSLEDATERMLHVFGEPAERAAAKADDDFEQTGVRLTLRCPLTLVRMSSPARGTLCTHSECFDLESHLQMQCAVKCPRWVCPLCAKSARPHELVIDPYLQQVLDETQGAGLTEVELQPDGSWKPVVEPPPSERSGKRRKRAVASAADAAAPAGERSAAPMAEAEAALSRIPQCIGAPGVTRPGVTRFDLARLYADTRALGTGGAPSYDSIRSLVLSLEEDPADAAAQRFADQIAGEIMRANGVSVPSSEAGGGGEGSAGGANATALQMLSMRARAAQLQGVNDGAHLAGSAARAVVDGRGSAPDDPICLD